VRADDSVGTISADQHVYSKKRDVHTDSDNRSSLLYIY
jgi:hypothetical protein